MDPIQPLYADRLPELSWRAGETIVELDDRPHLLTRIELRGRSFPQLDAQPFLRIAGREEAFRSWFANVSEDGASFVGYFAVDALVAGGDLEYGYGNRVFGRVRGFEPAKIQRLDKRRLPRGLVAVKDSDIQRRQAGPG